MNVINEVLTPINPLIRLIRHKTERFNTSALVPQASNPATDAAA